MILGLWWFFFFFCEFVRLLCEPVRTSAKWQRIPPLPYMLCEESALSSLLVTSLLSLWHVGTTEKQWMLFSFFMPLVILLTSVVSSSTLHLFQPEESWSILLPCSRKAILRSIVIVLFCNLFQLFCNPFGLLALCKVFTVWTSCGFIQGFNEVPSFLTGNSCIRLILGLCARWALSCNFITTFCEW